MYYTNIKERAKYLKKAEKGASTMCEEKKEMARNLLKDGELSVEKIAAAVELPVEEIEEIRKSIELYGTCLASPYI